MRRERLHPIGAAVLAHEQRAVFQSKHVGRVDESPRLGAVGPEAQALASFAIERDHPVVVGVRHEHGAVRFDRDAGREAQAKLGHLPAADHGAVVVEPLHAARAIDDPEGPVLRIDRERPRLSEAARHRPRATERPHHRKRRRQAGGAIGVGVLVEFDRRVAPAAADEKNRQKRHQQASRDRTPALAASCKEPRHRHRRGETDRDHCDRRKHHRLAALIVDRVEHRRRDRRFARRRQAARERDLAERERGDDESRRSARGDRTGRLGPQHLAKPRRRIGRGEIACRSAASAGQPPRRGCGDDPEAPEMPDDEDRRRVVDRFEKRTVPEEDRRTRRDRDRRSRHDRPCQRFDRGKDPREPRPIDPHRVERNREHRRHRTRRERHDRSRHERLAMQRDERSNRRAVDSRFADDADDEHRERSERARDRRGDRKARRPPKAPSPAARPLPLRSAARVGGFRHRRREHDEDRPGKETDRAGADHFRRSRAVGVEGPQFEAEGPHTGEIEGDRGRPEQHRHRNGASKKRRQIFAQRDRRATRCRQGIERRKRLDRTTLAAIGRAVRRYAPRGDRPRVGEQAAREACLAQQRGPVLTREEVPDRRARTDRDPQAVEGKPTWNRKRQDRRHAKRRASARGQPTTWQPAEDRRPRADRGGPRHGPPRGCGEIDAARPKPGDLGRRLNQREPQGDQDRSRRDRHDRGGRSRRQHDRRAMRSEGHVTRRPRARRIRSNRPTRPSRPTRARRRRDRSARRAAR